MILPGYYHKTSKRQLSHYLIITMVAGLGLFYCTAGYAGITGTKVQTIALEAYFQENDSRRLEHLLTQFIHSYQPNAQYHPEHYETYLLQHQVARFLAIHCEENSDFLNTCIGRFPRESQIGKQALLVLFQKCKSDTLKQRLLIWSAKEEDEEKKLVFDQLAWDQKPVHQILEQPIRDRQLLAEQWAWFFAKGNTQVVQASVDLLGNSVVGHHFKFEKNGDLTVTLLAREKRLRENVWHALARALSYSAVRKAFLAHPSLLERKEAYPILVDLIQKAYENKDRDLIHELKPYFLKASTRETDALFLEGIELILNAPEKQIGSTIRRLEKQKKLEAEVLRGLYADTSIKSSCLEQTAIPFVQYGKHFSVKMSSKLAHTKSYRTKETWLVGPDRDSLKLKHTITTLVEDSEKARCALFTTKFEVDEAWFLDDKHDFRYTDKTGKWIKINNAIIHDRNNGWFGLEGIRNFLATTIPTKTEKINTKTNEIIAVLHFNNCQQQDVFSSPLEHLLDMHQLQYDATIYAKADQTELLFATFTGTFVDSNNQQQYFSVEKTYYEMNRTKLDWLKTEVVSSKK